MPARTAGTREKWDKCMRKSSIDWNASLFFQALSQLLLYHARTGMNLSCPLGRRDAGWEITADISTWVTWNTRSDLIYLKWEINLPVPQICWQRQEKKKSLIYVIEKS